MLVTPARIRAVYSCLRAHPPFDRWKLPEDIRYELTSNPEDDAEFYVDTRDRMVIVVNPWRHITYNAVAASVAHEMIHLRQYLLGRLPDDRSRVHNQEFQRLASLVCRNLGFDRSTF